MAEAIAVVAQQVEQVVEPDFELHARIGQ